MISIKKNFYSFWVACLATFILGLMIIVFYFAGFQILPAQLHSQASQFCLDHLEDRSYQIKQLILENINNSKLWVQNRQNAFFDSRWLAISYYEQDGREWVLKDFKVNPVASNLYNMSSSDFIKSDQSMVFPHFQSEQVGLQETSLQNVPLLVIDVPNFLSNVGKNHLVRISLFSDIFVSTLSSNEKCELNLFDTRGNFLIQKDKTNDIQFLENFQISQPDKLATEVASMDYSGNLLFAKKIFKNLFVMAKVQTADSIFKLAFLEIMIVTLLLGLALIWVLGRTLQAHFFHRVETISEYTRGLAKNNAKPFMSMEHEDELTTIEEELSTLSEELKRKRK